MTKHICPNCDIELDYQYVVDWDERGRLYRPMWICGICSYGWYVDWKEE